MGRTPTRAEIEVATELQRRGLDVSPRQVARWREQKIISAVREWPGAGGSKSHYTAETVDLAEALKRVLDERRSLRDAVLILFGRGEALDPEVVKRALVEYLERAEEAMTKAVSNGRTPAAIRASLKTTNEGRAMLRFLEGSELDETSFVNVCAGLAGERKAWVSEFIVASGFGAIAGQVLDEDTREMLDRELSQFTIPAVKGAVSSADADQLARGMEDARAIVPFISSFTELLARGANEPNALLLEAKTDLDEELNVVHWVAIALWARERGVDLDAALVLANQYGDGLAAALQLARTFSWTRGPLFGPNREEERAKLPDYELESVDERIVRWAAENPDGVEAIKSLTSADA